MQGAEHRVGAVPVRPQLHGRVRRPARRRRGTAGGRRSARSRPRSSCVSAGMRRAGDVGDDAARAGRAAARRRAARAAARRARRRRRPAVATGPPAADAAHRGRCRARPAARGRSRRRSMLAGVADADVDRPGRGDPADQLGAVLADLVGGQSGAARGRQRGQQRRLAARTGAEVEPALVRARRAGRRRGRARTAGCPRPARRRGARGPRRGRPGRRRTCAPRTASTARPRRRLSATSSSRVAAARPGHEVGPRPFVVGVERSLRLVQVVAERGARRPRRSTPGARCARRAPLTARGAVGQGRDPAVPVALDHPAQDGVDEARGAAVADGVREVDGGGHGGVRRDAGAQRLVGAEPKQVAARRRRRRTASRSTQCAMISSRVPWARSVP